MKLPEDVRVELIDGVFYEKYPADPITGMAAPNRKHQDIVTELVYKIRGYIDRKGGDCKIYPAPFAVRLKDGDKNTVEPDVSVICDKSKLTDDGCTGAPDWIIEIISPSNPGHDYIRKLNLYLDAGVREYWIINPLERLVSVYEFGKGITAPKEYSFDDEISAGIYEDLKICLQGF
ncbi:MAG: Uma2 family endonuclease [Lachnospiraceae bacterium]|nr:Uma2 family endonuclease [Lachnospiraceae bacterium]